MKKYISLLIIMSLMFSFFIFDANAIDDEFVPYVTNFVITSEIDEGTIENNSTKATGLIHSYGLQLTKTGTTLNISGLTSGSTEVVRSGFKDLTVQRRKSSAYDWEDYYEYGNVYRDSFAASLSTTLVVASGYQYRISCKHYAKKNILSVQTIANTSNIVTVS